MLETNRKQHQKLVNNRRLAANTTINPQLLLPVDVFGTPTITTPTTTTITMSTLPTRKLGRNGPEVTAVGITSLLIEPLFWLSALILLLHFFL